MTKPKIKIYHSNYSVTITVAVGLCLLAAIAMLQEQTIFLNPKAYLIFFVGVMLMATFDANTWLKLTDKKLKSFGTTFGPRTIDLSEITEIRRVGVSPIFRKSGANLAYYGERGFLLYTREANYSLETLRKFLTDLKQRAPFIKFDPQYEHLIKDDFPEPTDFRRLPATQTQY